MKKMKKMALAVAAAAVMAAPLFVIIGPARSGNFELAQLDVQIGGDRDNRRDRREGTSIEVGPGGVTVGPKKRRNCRTVTTTIERDDGRKVKKTERRCDD